MHALSDYSQAIDDRGEFDETQARAHESAVDAVFIDLKHNPLRAADRSESLQSLMDSQTGPSPNLHHASLIEGLAALDADLIAATDAVSVRRRMVLLDAIVCTAFDDVLLARAEQAVRS